ncbi:MAG TPA: site-specific integrase [bacterium]|nr:site-specific integrase [bacterium]HOM27247.1 site-specific integrase [bacterium]
MRRGEIVNLKWQDIDMKERIITLWDTKSKEKRYVPMNEIVFQTLLNIEKDPLSEYVFYGKDKNSHISEHYISHLFEKIIKKAGITNFRFHDLRHTFASWLVMKGVNLKTVQELMGHKDFTTTLRYAHLSPEHKKLAVEILSDEIKFYLEEQKSGTYLALNRKEEKSEVVKTLENT